MKRRGQARLLEQTIVTLVCAMLVALGWNAPGAPRSSERFPCELCHCGCADARECWTNCCCYTDAERARWAKAHGVTPPWWFRPPANERLVATERPACCRTATADETCATPPTPRRLDDETCKAKPKLRVVAMTILTRPALEPWRLVHALFTLDSAWRTSLQPRRLSIDLDPPPPRAADVPLHVA